MEKEEKIEDIQSRVTRCTHCRLHKTRINAVPGEGSIETNLMIIAQAPGKVEDKAGRMFLGPSGKVLNDLLKELDLRREEFYMTNLLKCILPKSRKPRADEIETCSTLYLLKEIEYINPKVLITLGYHATKTLMKLARTMP